MFELLSQAEVIEPIVEHYGVTAAVIVSTLGGLGLMLRWLTTHVDKQNESFRQERKESNEQWQTVVQQNCDRSEKNHQECTARMDRALGELTSAIRENRKL